MIRSKEVFPKYWGLSEKIWVILIPSTVTLLLAVITAYGQYNQREASIRAAKKVEEVRVELKAEDQKVAGKLVEIHTLVNSQYGIALALNASNARFRANNTGLKEDIAAAELAERLLREHKENQSQVDGQAKGR